MLDPFTVTLEEFLVGSLQDFLALPLGQVSPGTPELAKVLIGLVVPDPLPGIEVVAGPVRLSQVLVNLLTNAVDVCKDRADSRIMLSVEEPGDGLVSIIVADNGPGFDVAEGESIFDPFYPTKEVGEGLGLGLSIAYNIVRDFGGRLEASRGADGGAVLTVTLKRPERGLQAAE